MVTDNFTQKYEFLKIFSKDGKVLAEAKPIKITKDKVEKKIKTDKKKRKLKKEKINKKKWQQKKQVDHRVMDEIVRVGVSG